MNGNQYLYADDRRICLQAVNTETANREEIARLQSQTQALRHEMMMEQLNARLNYVCRMEEEPEKEGGEPVKKPESPFEIRVCLWNTLNEEIAQVEEFLKNLTLKQPWIAKFFLRPVLQERAYWIYCGHRPKNGPSGSSAGKDDPDGRRISGRTKRTEKRYGGGIQ